MSNPTKPAVHLGSLLAALALLSLLAAFATGCGARSSPQAGDTPLPLGTLRLVKTTGRVITLTGGTTSGVQSSAFQLPPRGSVTGMWQCQHFGEGSSFSATLQYGFPYQSTEQLADTSRGALPWGVSSFTNLDETDGRVLPIGCDVLVTAKGCRWSLDLIVGGHTLVTYDNPVLAFDEPSRRPKTAKWVRRPSARVHSRDMRREKGVQGS